MAEKTNKLVLDNREMTEEFFENSRLLGIMAPVKDYQFCWHLNSMIGLDFRVNHDIEIRLIRKKREYFFSVYEFGEPVKFLHHYVYNNKCDGEYLLSEFRHFDFLWLMKGDAVSDGALQDAIQTIRSIPAVQLITELDVAVIGNKENLVF